MGKSKSRDMYEDGEEEIVLEYKDRRSKRHKRDIDTTVEEKVRQFDTRRIND